jgi:hypothetical protein
LFFLNYHFQCLFQDQILFFQIDMGMYHP